MSRTLAQQLNQTCFCVRVDRSALIEKANLAEELIESRPHLVSSAPVFLGAADAAAMMDVVRAVEAAAALDGYRAVVRERAEEIAQRDFGPAGAFMGYDFHLTDDGPKLIEVNTNAGGAFLNALVARAQSACCTPLDGAASLAQRFEAAVVAMFEREWTLQRGAGRPQRIAIVDDAPQEQYLYPEFLLAQRLLEQAGFEATIVDAQELTFEGGALRPEGRAIDLVYNRLTDFALSEPAHAPLRDAYRAGAVVMTPNPHTHALYADKRDLPLLSDGATLAAWGLAPEHVRALRHVPKAELVSEQNAAALWAARKSYFFKPVCGYGGRAVYRGDKLTKSAWEHILRGGYIAQERADPSERAIRVGDETRTCKLDVRLYTYRGELLLAAARVYQGQTTNFRTPGGGFAPVLVV